MTLSKIKLYAIKLLKNELIQDLAGKSFHNDKTSKLLEKEKIKVNIVAREKLILCGIEFIKQFIKQLDKGIHFETKFSDGDLIKSKETIAIITGEAKKILSSERTILNFLQHLSSISSTTYDLIKVLNNSKIKLLDTRKTITGLRIIQKYATQVGGARNHRMGLYDDILIKDNHIKVLGGMKKTLQYIREKKIKKYKIECDNYNQVKLCIESGARYLLLDNMSVNEIKKSIKFKKNKKVKFEITGGINKKNISNYSKLKIDYISVGFITQNPISKDIGLDII